MNRTMRFLSVVLLVFVLAGAAGTVLAQDEPPADGPTDDEVNEVAKELYCPVCENIPLDVCGTQACKQWRDEIRDLLAEGYTPDEVKTEFAANYGDRVLAEPPASDGHLLFWLIPPVVVVAGVVVLVQVLRSSSQPGAAKRDTDQPEDDPDDAYRAQLERELEERA